MNFVMSVEQVELLSKYLNGEKLTYIEQTEIEDLAQMFESVLKNKDQYELFDLTA